MLIWSYLRREDFGNSIMVLLKVGVMRVSNFLSVVYCIIICVTPPTTLAHFQIFFSSWILYYTQEYAQCQPKKRELGSVGIFYKNDVTITSCGTVMMCCVFDRLGNELRPVYYKHHVEEIRRPPLPELPARCWTCSIHSLELFIPWKLRK